MTVTRGDGLPRLEGAADPDAVMHTSTMNGANGSADDERGPVTSEEETLAGVLGPPPRLPDPDKGWDELVEEAAAAEYLAKERRSSGEAGDDGD
jgi:hypothetical protein